MNEDALIKKLGELADLVLADPRWQQDDLSVQVFGMLLYGYAMTFGRTILFMNVEDIDAAVVECLTEHVKAAPKWSGGLVAEANASAFNEAHHPGHFELIGVGHSYFTAKNKATIIDNVFANIAAYQQHARRSRKW